MTFQSYQTPYMPLYVRNQRDVDTCHEVHVRDVYRVRKLYDDGFRPKVIVDIGAHIGTFSTLAAHTWPEARVFSFEAQLDSFAVLANNIPENVTAVRAAVLGWYGRESGKEILQSHGDEETWRKTFGRCVSFQTLAAIVGAPIDFLKIDCEQSEVNILREMDELGAIEPIQRIHGEWHLPLSREIVKRLLTVHHTLEIVEGHDLWDMFWATHK